MQYFVAESGVRKQAEPLLYDSHFLTSLTSETHFIRVRRSIAYKVCAVGRIRVFFPSFVEYPIYLEEIRVLYKNNEIIDLFNNYEIRVSCKNYGIRVSFNNNEIIGSCNNYVIIVSCKNNEITPTNCTVKKVFTSSPINLIDRTRVSLLLGNIHAIFCVHEVWDFLCDVNKEGGKKMLVMNVERFMSTFYINDADTFYAEYHPNVLAHFATNGGAQSSRGWAVLREPPEREPDNYLHPNGVRQGFMSSLSCPYRARNNVEILIAQREGTLQSSWNGRA